MDPVIYHIYICPIFNQKMMMFIVVLVTTVFTVIKMNRCLKILVNSLFSIGQVNQYLCHKYIFKYTVVLRALMHVINIEYQYNIA